MTYNNSFQLEKLRDDPDFSRLFAKKAIDIQKNKDDLVGAANNYNNKYKKEIEDGTIKRLLMLAEGKIRGLTEDEVFSSNQLFIPTANTPILNYLYFIMREEGDHSAAIKVLRAAEDLDTELSLLKESFDKKYGTNVHEDHETNKEIPNVVSYIYGSMGDNTMETLKKLKTMAMSDNEKEAFVAFRKGRELAIKYKLDWDKIPYNR